MAPKVGRTASAHLLTACKSKPNCPAWHSELRLTNYPSPFHPPHSQAMPCSTIPVSQDLIKLPNREFEPRELQSPEQALHLLHLLTPQNPPDPALRPQAPLPALPFPALWHRPPHHTLQMQEATLSRADVLPPSRSQAQQIQESVCPFTNGSH